jgi:O-acetylhomoserine (thiol)-lyase
MGYRIVPVNPRTQEILGETAYPILKAIPFPVHVVQVFRSTDAAPGVVLEAAAARAVRVIWLQEGRDEPLYL